MGGLLACGPENTEPVAGAPTALRSRLKIPRLHDRTLDFLMKGAAAAGARVDRLELRKPAPSAGRRPKSGPLTTEQIQSIEEAVRDQLSQGTAPGYSMAIWRDGAVIYSAAFGAKNAAGERVTTNTLFQIGSDTKKISAIALLQEIEAGRATLDEPLGQLAPELRLASNPRHLAGVTVRDLLAHRSGLFDYTPWIDAPRDAMLARTLLGRFDRNEHVLMPSGIAYNYSNPDYSIVGYLTERLEGLAWPDIVTRRVFAPLGMNHTYARLRDALARERDVASGDGLVLTNGFDSFSELEEFVPPPGGVGWTAPSEQFDNAFVRPAGLVWSTPADQARLLGFLIDGNRKVLGDELRQQLTRVQVAELPHATFGYGLGLFASPVYVSRAGDFYQVPFAYHGGNTPSMSSGAILLPEQRIAVSVLSNAQDDPGVDLLGQLALEVAAEGRLPSPDPDFVLLQPPSDDLEGYAGNFHDPQLGPAAIRWQGDHLTIEIPALAAIGDGTTTADLDPLALDVFRFELQGQPLDLSFYPAPDGRPRAYAVNRSFVLTRDR